MKKLALAVASAALVSAGVAIAARNTELNPFPRHLPTQERFAREFAGGGGGGGNLINHGGPTITSAHVVAIFWGPSWAQSGSTDNGISNTLAAYIANYGTTGEYNVITQYSGIRLTSLATDNPAVWYDSSTPPTNVTDADVQAEASKYISSFGFDSSAIYEVFLPSSSYSSENCFGNGS